MNRWLGIFLGIAAAAIAVYATGAYEYLRPTALRDLLLGLGVWGPVVYVLAFMLGQILQLPGQPFLLAAALTWPRPMAFAVAWLGCILCGLPSFLFARYVAHDWVQARLPARLRKYEARMVQGGVRAVILLRLILFLSPLLPPALALSRVRLREFLIGTAIGLLPEVIVWTVFGPRLFAWFMALPRSIWAVLAVAAGLITLAVFAYHWRAAAPAPPAAPEPAPQPEGP